MNSDSIHDCRSVVKFNRSVLYTDCSCMALADCFILIQPVYID